METKLRASPSVHGSAASVRKRDGVDDAQPSASAAAVMMATAGNRPAGAVAARAIGLSLSSMRVPTAALSEAALTMPPPVNTRMSAAPEMSRCCAASAETWSRSPCRAGEHVLREIGGDDQAFLFCRAQVLFGNHAFLPVFVQQQSSASAARRSTARPGRAGPARGSTGARCV